MMQLKHLGLCVAAGFSMNAMAADFSFDRPGSGIGTGITPVGQLAWEQGLANAHYAESTGNKCNQGRISITAKQTAIASVL